MYVLSTPRFLDCCECAKKRMCASVTACKRNGEEKKGRMVEIQVRREWKGARLMEQRLCKGSCSVVGNSPCTSKMTLVDSHAASVCQ